MSNLHKDERDKVTLIWGSTNSIQVHRGSVKGYPFSFEGYPFPFLFSGWKSSQYFPSSFLAVLFNPAVKLQCLTYSIIYEHSHNELIFIEGMWVSWHKFINFYPTVTRWLLPPNCPHEIIKDGVVQIPLSFLRLGQTKWFWTSSILATFPSFLCKPASFLKLRSKTWVH